MRPTRVHTGVRSGRSRLGRVGAAVALAVGFGLCGIGARAARLTGRPPIRVSAFQGQSARTSGPAKALPDIDKVLDAYEAHPTDVQALSPDALRPLLEGLKATAPTWVDAAGESAARRRRLAVATFVVEVLLSEPDPALWRKGQPAIDLLEWACLQLRKQDPTDPPEVGEHIWFLATMALLERSGGSSLGPEARTRLTTSDPARPRTGANGIADTSVSQMLEYHLEDAKLRIPDEPRWAIVRGLVEELKSWPDWRDEAALNVQPVPVAATTVAYEEALGLPPVRQEALVRLGEFELRLGLTAKALDYFRQAGAPKDPYVAYWLNLFEGDAFERSNRPADAVTAYRAALAVAPYAQTATVALGSALMTQHHGVEGATLVGQMLRMPARPDPWTIFTFPDWRYLPDAIAKLRKAVTK